MEEEDEDAGFTRKRKAAPKAKVRTAPYRVGSLIGSHAEDDPSKVFIVSYRYFLAEGGCWCWERLCSQGSCTEEGRHGLLLIPPNDLL